MCEKGKMSPLVSGQVGPYGTSLQTRLVTPWQLLYKADAARVYEEVRAMENDYRQEVMVRTATFRTDEPSAWSSATGATRSANGVYVSEVSLTTLTGALWVQFGTRCKSNGASTAGEAWSSLQVALDTPSKVVGSRTVVVQPVTNSGSISVVPLTGLLPAMDLAGVMVGFVVSGVSGTLNYGLVYRTFDGTDVTRSGVWSDLASYTGVTADELRNSGDLTPLTLTSKLSAQVGLKYSGSAEATIRAVVAARWA